jgi:hypothetical protein
MQFVTGEFWDAYWNGFSYSYTKKCLLAKFTTRGDLVDVAHVDVTAGSGQYSVCSALTLVPNT